MCFVVRLICLHCCTYIYYTVPFLKYIYILQITVFACSDDSRQFACTVGCITECVYRDLKKSFPWLTESILISDQCPDYHGSPSIVFNHEIGRLTGIRIAEGGFTEVQHGMSSVGGGFGQLQQGFATTLGKINRRDALDLFNALCTVRRKGDRVLLVVINRSLFKEDKPKTIPLLSRCQWVEYPATGGIILHEAFDIGEGRWLATEGVRPGWDYGGT